MPPLPCPPPRGHSPRSWHNVPPPLGSLCLSLMPLLRCCVLASLDLHPSGPHPHLTWAGCHAAPSQARPTSPHCKVWRPGLVVPRLPTRRRDGVGYPSPGPGPPSVHLDFRPLILPPPPTRPAAPLPVLCSHPHTVPPASPRPIGQGEAGEARGGPVPPKGAPASVGAWHRKWRRLQQRPAPCPQPPPGTRCSVAMATRDGSERGRGRKGA